jgi:hypothetical protein
MRGGFSFDPICCAVLELPLIPEMRFTTHSADLPS